MVPTPWPTNMRRVAKPAAAPSRRVEVAIMEFSVRRTKEEFETGRPPDFTRQAQWHLARSL